jgi:DNA-binding NtrC family response regulator
MDEIGTMPHAQQAKLLRVLQTGEFQRVGSSKTRRVDVRVLAATNLDIRQAAAEGRFREDLLFRLNTVEIHLPPLRERRDDIPPLASHFLARQAARYRKELGGFEPDAMQALLAYAWPGNIRELEHTVERAVLLALGPMIAAGDLALRAPTAAATLEEMSLEDAERLLIRKALARFNGNVSQAADALGLSRSALYRRLERFGLQAQADA